MKTFLVLLVLFILMATAVPAQSEYLNNQDLARELREAVSRGGAAFQFGYLDAESKIPMASVGSGGPHDPILLIIGGLDGRHLTGSSLALSLIRHLADNPTAVDEHLGDKRVVVVPRVNLSADGMFGGSLRAEQGGLEALSDSDHDGLIGEDDWDDLNGDGRVGLVRVEDPRGTYVEDGDGSFLRPAKEAEGERGRWMLLTEGKDDDQDGAFNEEADGGANPSRNFSFDYPWFARDAGDHQVSLFESRAVADYLVANRNVAVVLVYGFEDNLLSSPSVKDTSDPDLSQSRWGRKPVDKPNKHDVPLIRHLGQKYRETLNLPKKAKNLTHESYGVLYKGLGPGFDLTSEETSKGSLAGYVYYHRGRLALATPGWTAGMQMALAPKDTTRERSEQRDDVAESIIQEEAFRDWLLERVDTGWSPWTPLNHPDFPDQRVEVGGYAPHARLNPPPETLEDLADAHNRFAIHLLDSMPRVQIQEAAVKELGNGLYEVEVVVENTGYLPDVLAQGVRATHARPTRIELSGGDVVGGRNKVLLDRLSGQGGHQELRFVVRTSQGLTLDLISEMAGTETLTLKSGDHYRRDAQ